MTHNYREKIESLLRAEQEICKLEKLIEHDTRFEHVTALRQIACDVDFRDEQKNDWIYCLRQRKLVDNYCTKETRDGNQ